PIVFWQIWAFVAPGLYSHEKRYAIPFVVMSTVMFLTGAVFCYYLVLPWTIQWLLSYGQASAGAETAINYQLTINTYIRDSTKILIAFGLVFEFPLLIAFLAAAGVVTHRTLLAIWKYAVVAIFILGALLTPPEPVSQLMMAVPMIVLFFASVGIAYLITKSKGDPGASFEEPAEHDEIARDEAEHHDAPR
ncbi:MAG: twin-arginine translocase subunit TatC, partial [Myxococcales bacterium]|nr:twin-arginine translocase subunit TatC [Myxococcales bacterium]